MSVHDGPAEAVAASRGYRGRPVAIEALGSIHRVIHNMWITVWETCQRQRVESTTPTTITPKPIKRFQLLSVLMPGTLVPVLAVT